MQAIEWLAEEEGLIHHKPECETLQKAGVGAKCTCGRDEAVKYLTWISSV